MFLSTIQSPQGTLFEVLYDPWPTSLSQSWASAGRDVIDGLDLLIHQAISQVELFSGEAVKRSEFYTHLRKAALSQLG
jgi:shikimate dehydrogenase